MDTIWLILARYKMVLDASKTNSRGNAHNLTDFCNEKKMLWMRPKPFLYINLDNLTDLSTEKWFWMRPKPTLEEMHTIWLVFAMKNGFGCV